MSLLLHSYTDLQEVPVEAVPGLSARPAAVSRRGGRAHGGGEVVALVVALPRLTLRLTLRLSPASPLSSPPDMTDCWQSGIHSRDLRPSSHTRQQNKDKSGQVQGS